MRLEELFDADDSSSLSRQILSGSQTDGLVTSLVACSVQQSPLLTDAGARLGIDVFKRELYAAT